MAFPPFHTKKKENSHSLVVCSMQQIYKDMDLKLWIITLLWSLHQKLSFGVKRLEAPGVADLFDKNIEMRCTWKWTPWRQWIYHKNTVLGLRTDDSHVDGFLFNGFVLTLFVDVCLDFSIAQYMEDWYLTYKKILLSRIRKENISQTN